MGAACRPGCTCRPRRGTPPLRRASPHLPSARFMPASAAQRGSTGPLPARRRFRFRRQSASSTAAAEPEDVPEATQRSCSKATGSVRFLIPRPTQRAAKGARWPCPRRPRRSRHRSETPPPGSRRPSHPKSQAAAAGYGPTPGHRPRRPISTRFPPAPPPERLFLGSAGSAPSIPGVDS